MDADPKLVRDIFNAGGKTLKKCMQCATCSVVCPLSPDENPFPRKEMIWAQWGLRSKLLKDRDIWLCYQCNDCSAYCPRGAQPGQIMAALRAVTIANYSFPSWFARLFLNAAYLPLLYVIPIVLMGIYFATIAPHGFALPAGKVVFTNWIPHEDVEAVGLALGAWVFFAVGVGIFRYWTALSSEKGRIFYVPRGVEGEGRGPVDVVEGLFYAILDVIFHRRFNECGESKYRFYAHLGVFYGFILLGISTLIAVVYMLQGRPLGLPLTDPAKIIGNTGAVLLFFGTTWLVYERFVKKDKVGFGGYFDWFFLGNLYAVAITGILTEALRVANVATAYYMYAIHLIFVFVLLIYAPYSKFAHLAYRTIALAHDKSFGR